MDWLIDLREKLLDTLSGVQADDALNDSAAGSITGFGTDPAADLKRALDRIKFTALDDSGVHVEYAALRTSNAYEEFRTLRSPHLRSFDPAELASREERLAFWINLYNVLVMDAVIALDIQRSVREGKLGLLNFFRRAAYNVGGHRTSLDDVEHGILRGNRGNPMIPGRQFVSQDPRLGWVIWPPEPRIHFALNCASRSCPPIQVYTADKLESQLELAVHNFVNGTTEVNPVSQILILSSIFKWFENDFGGRAGVLTFLVDHLPEDERQAWISPNQNTVRLQYKPFDWSLNSVLFLPLQPTK